MRFGVSVHHFESRAQWRATVADYDSRGFDLLCTADHLGGMAPPLLPLVAAAEVSDRMRFATNVLNNDFWHPVLLARDVAAAQVLTGGRFELGIGAGHAQAEYEAAGIAYDPPRRRVARMAEAVSILRRLLDGETVDHDGAYHHVNGVSVGFPVDEPVPLLVGGNGDRVLQCAAEVADHVGYTGFTSGTGQVQTNLSHFTWAGLEERVAHVAAHAAGRPSPPPGNVLVQVVDVGSPTAAAGVIAERTGQSIDAILDSPFVLLGDVSRMSDHVDRLEALGVETIVAFDGRGAELLAPLIEHRA